jgi:hypothetical protein
VGCVRSAVLRHSLKLLSCFAAYKLCGCLAPGLPHGWHTLPLLAGAALQLAACVSFASAPKRAAFTGSGMLYLAGRLFQHWASISSAHAQLLSASAAELALHRSLVLLPAQPARAPPPISIPSSMSHLPLRHSPPPISAIPSPFLSYTIPLGKRCCAPFLSAIPCLHVAPAWPVVPALAAPAALLILVLIYLLTPLLYIGLAYVRLRWLGNYGPLARRWYNRQCMVCKVQRIRCRLLFRQWVRWFMAPFLPVFLHETRKEVIGCNSRIRRVAA